MSNKKSGAKVPRIKPINNFLMLTVLSIFQVVTGFIGAASGPEFQGNTGITVPGGYRVGVSGSVLFCHAPS